MTVLLTIKRAVPLRSRYFFIRTKMRSNLYLGGRALPAVLGISRPQSLGTSRCPDCVRNVIRPFSPERSTETDSTMGYVVNIVQLVIALGLLNVWLLRREKPTSWRGGAATNLPEEFAACGLSSWSVGIAGGLKIGLSILLILGIWMPSLTVPAATVLAVLMLGVIAVHFRVGDTLKKSFPAISLLVLCLLVIFLQAAAWGGRPPTPRSMGSSRRSRVTVRFGSACRTAGSGQVKQVRPRPQIPPTPDRMDFPRRRRRGRSRENRNPKAREPGFQS